MERDIKCRCGEPQERMKEMHVFQPVKFEDIETGPYRFGGDNWMLITSAKDQKTYYRRKTNGKQALQFFHTQ